MSSRLFALRTFKKYFNLQAKKQIYQLILIHFQISFEVVLCENRSVGNLNIVMEIVAIRIVE